MEEFEVAMVGGGNMGAALLEGMIASQVFDPSTVAVVEKIGARRAELSALVPGVTVSAEMVPCASAVIAVKPDGAADAVRDAVRAGARRVPSIAAGVRTSSLDDAAGAGVATVRAMPNTPALVGLGAAAIAPGAAAGENDLGWAERILGSVGIVERLDEELLDAFTGVAGSGPAYVFRFAEVLADAAVAQGIDQAAAERVIAELLLGASTLLARDGNPAQLRTNVTSPGGTTAAGLDRMDAMGFADLVDATVRAATERSRELG